jgi:5-methylcytosine-specific restriction endonuclease McrA
MPGRARCRDCHRAHNRAWWANRTPEQVAARTATARAWKDDNRWRDIHYQMRKRGAQTIIMFTPEQRAQRFSMFAGCWLCGRREGLQGDHVKPLSRGGPHCLANIRPCCPTCNWLKADQWPLPGRWPGLPPARLPVRAPR